MTSIALTITETLRYRGKIGQWSWVLHRISGLGTLFFLFLHVIDTSWASLAPDLYKQAISEYQSPLFTFGEFILVACVVYHSLNGFRIVLFDFRPKWWKYQERAAGYVLIATAVVLVPTFFIMFAEVLRHYGAVGIDFKLGEIISSNAQFVVAIIAVLALGIVVSTVYSFVPGVSTAQTGAKKLKGSRFDRMMWSYMRISGVIMLPLVLGHLAMMHVIQGVFRITEPITPVGATVINATGTAVNFVAIRWNTMFAGVAIWRVYDILMLILVALHGFYGLHYAVNDYVHHKTINRGMQIAAFMTAVALIIIGGLGIISTIPVDTAAMIQQAAQTIK
jgi:succinate dehydrogenase / fumarate reductase cytochrome b subunit